MTTCTTYDESISYDAVLSYNGICISDCTLYDDALAYNYPIPYNGECIVPPTPTPSFRAGGGWVYPLRPLKKKLNEDEIMVLMLMELLDDD